MYRTPTACKHRVSGSFSLPSRGPFHLSFTVLCAIGHWVVFSLGGWSPRLPARFHVSRSTPDPARSMTLSPTGLSPSLAGLSRTFPVKSSSLNAVHTPGCTHPGLGSSAFDRLYLRNRFYFLFLRLLRCFSSPGSLRTPMDSVHGDGIAPAGFPHSEICGSRNMCFSPQLFAAYHVFLRLSVPGHSPRALSCLTSPTFPSPLPSCTLCCSYSRNEVSDVVLPNVLLAYKTFVIFSLFFWVFFLSRSCISTRP